MSEHQQKLEESWMQDRLETKTLVLQSFKAHEVPQEMIEDYFNTYDLVTDKGRDIAKWIDENSK